MNGAGAALLARLQAEAEPSGFHKELRAWVDDKSSVARVLLDRVDDIVNEVITDLYHPEFGSEWREDGSLYKIMEAARGDGQ